MADEGMTFDQFWDSWPHERRVCKRQARDQWQRVPPKNRAAVLAALAQWVVVWRARGQWQYVPHPHRWLRDERWDDALPAPAALTPAEKRARTARDMYAHRQEERSERDITGDTTRLQ